MQLNGNTCLNQICHQVFGASIGFNRFGKSIPWVPTSSKVGVFNVETRIKAHSQQQEYFKQVKESIIKTALNKCNLIRVLMAIFYVLWNSASQRYLVFTGLHIV